MTYDPEQIREERRAMPRPERPRTDAAEAVPSGPSEAELRTLQLLAKLREGSALANAERWLCVIRGDRKPATPAELEACATFLAPTPGANPEANRAGLVRVLLNHNDFVAIR